MKQIKLLGYPLYALVDDENEKWLRNFIWYRQVKSGKLIYAYTKIGKKTVNMHQLVLPSTDVNLTPDHINGNGLDNQKVNLRLATNSQQQQNKSKSKQKTSSKYKGVSWKSHRNKWEASIMLDYKFIYLGGYKTEIGAAKAYNKAAIKYFGEFAKLNEFNEILPIIEVGSKL